MFNGDRVASESGRHLLDGLNIVSLMGFVLHACVPQLLRQQVCAGLTLSQWG